MRDRFKGKPIISIVVLGTIIFVCLLCELFMRNDPTYMDLYNADTAPGNLFWLGTDTMGRDIFSMILYGGRISLLIGFFATVISTAIAIVLGSVSGVAPKWLDRLIMRVVDIVISIPSILLVVFIQALLGKPTVISVSVVIGVTSWMSIAKVVRTEVLKIKHSEYVIAAKCMGAGFFHVLMKHLIPNFVPSIMFMVIMNIRNAIITESTLSFLGLGLPLEIISWGSMLSLAERSFNTGSWWITVIPGVVLVITLMCITNIGNYIKNRKNKI